MRLVGAHQCMGFEVFGPGGAVSGFGSLWFCGLTTG